MGMKEMMNAVDRQAGSHHKSSGQDEKLWQTKHSIRAKTVRNANRRKNVPGSTADRPVGKRKETGPF